MPQLVAQLISVRAELFTRVCGHQGLVSPSADSTVSFLEHPFSEACTLLFCQKLAAWPRETIATLRPQKGTMLASSKDLQTSWTHSTFIKLSA